MKRVLSIAALALCAVAAMGQDPVITFTKTEHDFGKINEADGRVSTIFEFTNEGMVPLVLSNVRASCGCTTPKWPHEPIEPGQVGQITVTYNPNGRPGRFQKTITVTSNATEASKKLYIKGEVIPKPVKPVDQYPVKMGDLSLKQKSLNFGSLTQGNSKTLEIEYANETAQPITVSFLQQDKDYYYQVVTTLEKVEPQQTGKLQVTLQASECSVFGPVTTRIYMVVNGKRVLADAYAITLQADIREDFSRMSVAERQQAPIADLAQEWTLGTVPQGKKATVKVTVKNAGTNPLLIHRVLCNDPMLRITAPKAEIKGGHTATIKVEVNAQAAKGQPAIEPAQYSRRITLITNDPENPRRNIKLTWKIE